jgi:TetR/AcrR family transcriptional regulator
MAAKRDAARTMARILAAGTKEFAEKGLAGARVDSIARRSGSNKNMIYHYFRSKEGLFEAVLERMYATIRERQNDPAIRGLEPEEGMRKLIELTFDAFAERPEFISLINTENLCKARHVKCSPKILALYDPLIETIGGLLSRGEAKGVFRTGVDPVDLYISIVSLGEYYLSHRYTLSALLKTDLMNERRLKQRYNHVVDVILSYLRPWAAAEAADRPRAKALADA